MERFIAAFGHPIHSVLTDNGTEFTDRFGGAFYTRRTAGTGQHAFDRVCAAHGIRHKLTRPYRPQTNGMVERFNRRIAEALASRPALADNAGRNRFASHDERNAFIHDVVARYNRRRLRCVDYTAPLEHLANLTKHYTCAGMWWRLLQRSRGGRGPVGWAFVNGSVAAWLGPDLRGTRAKRTKRHRIHPVLLRRQEPWARQDNVLWTSNPGLLPAQEHGGDFCKGPAFAGGQLG